ncbi:asparagine synthase (glutamine-hydrolyzing) [Rapidithrix thailandica]|uniref:asparagine synthase (glutamine-hydrolyzing) n=1 Tax=Rapidithrix thailandica TaxID=413964 RepID=A0AAW9SCR7_9BACT
MCGITGFISPEYSQADLQKMTSAIRHRGADAEGLYFDEKRGLGLGHRRLSILDLSEAANQPFTSQCGRYVMVYNGEVYNYEEIKNEILKEKTLHFKTTSDTEVILEAFALWGTKCVERFNGMFAIAIFDLQEEALYLFRDRLGIKPIYIYQEGSELVFASELKAISSVVGKSKLTIDKGAISNFLYLGYIPAEQTVFKEVEKFPAGHFGLFKGGKLSVLPYWQVEQKVETTVLQDETLAQSQLHDLLSDAVRQRMISDVPLGTFLSGGIDSSTVTALAQANSPRPVKTFSIGFKEAKFNESVYAEKVAKHLGTEHHAFILSEQDALERVYQILDIYDQPYGDSSAIPTLLVSEMARKHVTVCLSGDGGDESFMGYGMYNWAKRLANPLVHSSRKLIAGLLELSGKSRLQRAAQVFDYSEPSIVKSHIFSQEQYLFSQEEIQQLLTPGFQTQFYPEEKFDQLSRALSPEEQQALYDVKHYLKDDLLVKVDVASMFHSLEVRVPLLDYRVVEFALNLDQSLKVKGGVSKYLLKQVLYQYVPAEIFDRPKWGFSIPLVKWLKTDLKFLIDQYLSEEIVEQQGVVQYVIVEKLKKDFLNGKYYLYNRLWVLILLHKYLLNSNSESLGTIS